MEDVQAMCWDGAGLFPCTVRIFSGARLANLLLLRDAFLNGRKFALLRSCKATWMCHGTSKHTTSFKGSAGAPFPFDSRLRASGTASRISARVKLSRVRSGVCAFCAVSGETAEKGDKSDEAPRIIVDVCEQSRFALEGGQRCSDTIHDGLHQLLDPILLAFETIPIHITRDCLPKLQVLGDQPPQRL